jgi:high-affinity iron transporter
LGALAAIAASMAAAIALALFNNGAHDDRIEAIVMAVAAVLMLYMSGWLFLKQNPARWAADVKRAADKALAAPGALALGGVAFLAVFREGAETVLFVQAIANTSGGWSAGLFTGLAGAAAILIVAFIAMQKLALQLPLRPVFLATSAILFVMGLRFVGAALQELQEMGVVDVTPSPLSETLTSLGFNGSWQALAFQAFIALVAIGGTALAARRAPASSFAPAE